MAVTNSQWDVQVRQWKRMEDKIDANAATLKRIESKLDALAAQEVTDE